MFLKLFQFFWLLFHLRIASAERLTTKSGCQPKCGDLIIPYPFGIGPFCSIDSWAEMECDITFYPPKLFLKNLESYEVVEFSQTEVFVKNNISTRCSHNFYYDVYPSLYTTPFTFSSKNKFISIGCGMLGIVYASGWLKKYKNDGGMKSNFTSGCMNFCDKIENLDERECEGFGCCEIYVPPGIKLYQIAVDTLVPLYSNINISPCGYAFLADENYKFNSSNINDLTKTKVRLNFAVGNQRCEYASQDPSSFACKENSICLNSNVTTGYICSCSKGYEGNPYLTKGCQDINECKHPNGITCTGKCFNTKGSYHCLPLLWLIILGLILALLLLLGGGLGIYGRNRRQLSKLREKFFQQNGGLLLQEKIYSHVGVVEPTKIFTAKELKLATNSYEKSRILGEGSFGRVYKGVLTDLRVVAIKKAKMIDKDQLEQFINEVHILTQINHRNIVKLLGCCLEVELPLLVYEFVSNGTLSEHISKKYDLLSWEDRLRIATEIASALAYLHSSASIPIIHRDVKSANILLDDDLTAKVADFGASRVNSLDETQISTLVKGTLGYLDPEYMLTNQLTQKSDVYSFGVVLAELLTGEKPLSNERSQEERSLAMYFTRSMREKQFLHIFQDGVVKEENKNQIEAVAELAGRCLHKNGEERPTMKEVAAELEGLRGFDKKHLSSRKRNQERVNLLSKQEELHPSSSYSGKIFEYTGIEMVVPLKDAR